MFCGTSTLRHDADDTPSSPKMSKKKDQRNKNPYSSRGLDKFTSVLSELEARRDKIMADAGAQGISMIRFMYSNSQDWIPVVVRMRDDRQHTNPIEPAGEAAEESPSSPKLLLPSEEKAEGRIPAMPWWKWRSSYYLPAMMVLMLASLMVFGRVFAIIGTSILWYSVPNLKHGGRSRGTVRRRVRRIPDKKIV